jgi:DNA-binding CsgD family transcriptional regulator
MKENAVTFNNTYVLRKQSLLIKETKAKVDVQGIIERTPSISKQLLNSSVAHIVCTFPGIVSWKDCDSRFLGCNNGLAELANLNAPEKIIDKSDEDMPWGENGYADIFREEDKEVIAQGTINFCLGKYEFASSEKVVLTQKTPIINSDGYITGIINYLTTINNLTITNITQTLLCSGVTIEPILIDYIKKLFIAKNDSLNISPREEECLYFLIRRLTAKDIGKTLGLSYRTVEFYINSLKKKLKCRKVSSLIIKAIKLGYMDNIPTSILAKKCA